MPRSKSPTNSAEIKAQIERMQRDQAAEIRKLQARRREAEADENRRRGELLMRYLGAKNGAELRQALAPFVAPDDRPLFGLRDARPLPPKA